MTKPINFKPKFSILFTAILFITITMSSCNNGSDTDAKAMPATSDSTNSASVKDTTASTTATKKVRKGKGSVAPAVDNKMKVEKGKDGVYSKAEQMPEFPGGETALSKYVEENVSYPQDALDQNKEGTVKVSFVVDEKGMVTDPVVMGNSAGRSMDAEATRVIKQMPAWKPGMVKGKAVKTRLDLPITFKLGDS